MEILDAFGHRGRPAGTDQETTITTDQAPTARRQDTTGTPHSPARQRRVRATLAVAGGVAVAVGTAIAVAPRSFIDIEGVPTADLLSETRAPGAALGAVGFFVVVAAIRRRRLNAAALMATLIYLGYGLARTASLALDGQPSGTIIGATIIELAIGLASLTIVSASHDA